MSRMDVTTQELFLRLGTTSLSRSTRADALFRRLRSTEQEQLAGDLMRAPKRVGVSASETQDMRKPLRRR
jgi:hypothetical protein